MKLGWGVPALALLCACRQGNENRTSSFEPIPPPSDGAHGCSGANQSFVASQAVQTVALSVLDLGPQSQIAARLDSELVYATGGDGAVVALDFSAGSPPAESVLVSGASFEQFLQLLGVSGGANLVGLAILDATRLLVADGRSHALYAIDTTTPDAVELFAGLPSDVPGFADGPLNLARFSFTRTLEIVPAGDGRVFLADPGNHALRLVQDGAVLTVAGVGSPFFSDGELSSAGFDTPSGLAVGCSGELFVSELGASGLGGQRLRSLRIGDPFFFGGFLGEAITIAGDGSAQTIEGLGTQASLAAPQALFATSAEELYWIDSQSGVLRRLDLLSGLCDCPMAADCASAVAAPVFSPGGSGFSMTQTPAGVLYVIDGAAGTLVRVTP
jgi:hypothetical protein